ncbi:MAG: NF038122 family metalloprotease [Rhodopila sp.]|nr:NF038122 family metalloprotease [Rhodopila sp.]
MQIDFIYDPSTSSAPAGFTAALAYVAGVLDALITNPITVNIKVGWNEIGGVTLGAGDVAEGGPLGGTGMSYANLVAALTANASNPADRQELASLPATAPPQIASYYIAPAQEKAWGLLSPTSSQPDGEIGFNAAYNYSFDPNNQSAPGLFGFIGIAEHEITHALGRIYGDGPLELVDYAAPGVFATPNTGGYFSIDGGKTNLGQFDATPNGDTADWAPPSNGDSFEYLAYPGLDGVLTPVDKTLLGVLGFNENPAPSPHRFTVANTSSGAVGMTDGTAYTGPVAGLTQELILTGSAGLNVTAHVQNSLIHTGSGNNAIDVSAAGGNNVLDGSGGSNFLTGGSGNDTFYVDDRDATAAIWSTIAGFHAGNSATIWGVTQAGFTIDWMDNQGAPGATGLTGSFTAPGKPDIDITLAGYTTADLSNGRLSVTFGTSPDEPGLPGSVYMNIRAV